MLPCLDPALPDPETATDRDVANALLEIEQAYVDCKRRQADLAAWVRGR
jgi:hypothetical protein